MSRRFKNEHEQGWTVSDDEHDELLRLRQQVPELQEIAVRVKLGQLEVWPDASMTQIGKSLREANAEIADLTAQLDRARTIPLARGDRVRFPDGTIINRDETAALRSKLERAEAETSRLREELEKAFERPGDPACASDAERDVDYWRLKASEHFTSFMGCDEERRAACAKLERSESEVRRLRELRDVEGLIAERDRLRDENERLSTFGPLRRLNDEWSEVEKKLNAQLARVDAVFGELFDREVLGEKLTAEQAIEAFRMSRIDAEPAAVATADCRVCREHHCICPQKPGVQ